MYVKRAMLKNSKKMKIKKNPKKDLNPKSGLHFAVGMLLVLMLTYVALEWKSFYDEPDIEISMIPDDELNEEVPITEFKLPDPPKPPQAPPVLEVIENDEPIIESVIDIPESDQETEVLKLEDIEVAEEPVPDTVIFKLIEEVPIFPGCENEKDKRVCFNQMMKKHVQKNFQYPEIAKEMGSQGKVYVRFVIQKDGSIGQVQMRGPDKNLEKDAARIISKLPKMTPGKQRGTAVKVPFSIPINY